EYQEYFPGQVLLALAVACQQGVSAIDEERLRRAFQYYRHRFRYKRHFGQVTWLLQAFSKWWEVTGDPQFAHMTFEIADWLLGYQQEKTGGFINDHQAGTPGYTTAVYLEGLAAAASIARGRRRATYLDSYARGLRFLDRLIIQERDRSILPNPDYAIGGLRDGMTRGDRGLDVIRGQSLAFGGFSELAHAVGDHRLVPQRAVLFRERRQLAGGVDARRQSRGLHEHQREQRVRLGHIRRRMHRDLASESNRLGAQIGAHEIVAGVRAVAFVEHQIDDFEQRVDA